MSTIQAATNGKALGSVSSLPPEIWRLVADENQSARTLSTLVKVCRAFRDIFTPVLYSRHILYLNKHRPEDFSTKTLIPNLSYTKDFEVHIGEFQLPDFTYDLTMNDDYASSVARMVRAMPNLRTFRWHDWSYESEHDPSLMPRNGNLMKALKSCKLLRHLYISFDRQWTDDEESFLKCTLPLAGFSNLTSLELHHFGGKENEQIKNIVSALQASPHLKRLGLGMGWNADCDGIPEILLARGDCDFLEKLCSQYQVQSGSPLQLETLRLGHGVFPMASKTPHVGNYLANLANLSKLTTLHVFNGLIRYVDEEDDQYGLLHVDWTIFDGCTSLRQLAVTRLGTQVRHWLNTSRQSLEELIVTDHYAFYNGDLKNFRRLRLPNLTFLFTREVTANSLPAGWVGSGSDSDDSDSESGDANLEPNSINATITVLDRLHDGGASLKHFGICLDLETSWEHFAAHLPNLTQLTQLRLDSKSVRPGGYPTKKSSLWPEVQKPKDISARYAQLIKSLCPSLQYVQVGEWVWNITIPGCQSERGADIYSQTNIRLLDYDEFVTFDLFSMHTFASESGLPEREEYPEEITDEERERTERIVEEVEARMKERRANGLFFDSSEGDEWEDEEDLEEEEEFTEEEEDASAEEDE